MKKCTNILDVISIMMNDLKEYKYEIEQPTIEKHIMLLTGWKRKVCIEWIRELEFMGYLKLIRPGILIICNGKPGHFNKT